MLGGAYDRSEAQGALLPSCISLNSPPLGPHLASIPLTGSSSRRRRWEPLLLHLAARAARWLPREQAQPAQLALVLLAPGVPAWALPRLLCLLLL